MAEEIPTVDPEDMSELLDRLRPGATYSADTLWTEYVRLMESRRRPLVTRNALGRALTAAGATRRRVRRRVSGKPVEISSWVLPGETVTQADEEQVLTVMADLGEGQHSNSLIFQRYAEIGRREGWRGMFGETAFARLLTSMGYVRTQVRGVPCRIVVARKVQDAPSRFFQG